MIGGRGPARLGPGEHEGDDAPAGLLGVETVRISGCHAGQNRRGEHLGQGVGIYVRADLAGRYAPSHGLVSSIPARRDDFLEVALVQVGKRVGRGVQRTEDVAGACPGPA